MLPAIFGIAGVALAAESFGYACSAGMFYAYGRKSGRKACEWIDGLGSRVGKNIIVE